MDLFTLATVAWFLAPVPLAFAISSKSKKASEATERAEDLEVRLNSTLKTLRSTQTKLSDAEKEFGDLLRREEHTTAENGRLQDRLDTILKSLRETTDNISEAKEENRLISRRLRTASDKASRAEFELSEIERLAFTEEDAWTKYHAPSFDFETSEEFKLAVKACKERQKAMAAKGGATGKPANFPGNMGARDAAEFKRQMQITLRAFNTECDAVISAVRWNNLEACEKKIRKSAEVINKLNLTTGVQIKPLYVDLKVEELHLVHQQREIAKKEKDERAEILRMEREEKKLLAEAAAAEKAEAKARADLAEMRAKVAAEADSKELRTKIAELEGALSQAEASTQRAKSMAELTKCGYVYVISNIGSFGEGIVKIGLTRRLDPNDRVKELGDASVPFLFDTHAMIYSEDAPTLESALHAEFDARRVNAANPRKEFFHATLDEVEEAVLRLSPDAKFFKDRDAQEWTETMAMRASSLAAAQ